MHPLQEKFQITVPVRGEGEGEGWVSANSEVKARAECGDPYDVDVQKFNYMPPGMELSNQTSAEINQMPLVMSGECDVSADTSPESLYKGFTRKHMAGSDDQYTGEHVDHFYGDAGGFTERNNYLDRL